MSETMPLISVIVPVYNCEKYLRECVNSIREQTYPNLEIILIDDGSTDRSGDICDEFSSLDDRIQVIHQSNGGQQCARTRGIECACGEYIGFVDADDYIDREMYMALYGLMGDADLVTSGMIKCDEGGHAIYDLCDLLPEGLYYDTDDILYDNLLFWSDYHDEPIISALLNNLVSKLFRLELAKKIYKSVNVSVVRGEDLLFVLAYVLQCKKICVSHKKFYYYRENNISVTHRVNQDVLSDRNRLYNGVMSLIRGHRKERELTTQFQKRFMYFLYTQTFNIMGIDDNILPPNYYFPDDDKLAGKKIVIFGAGKVGNDYVKYWQSRNYAQIVAVIDNKDRNLPVHGISVFKPKYVRKLNYDYIICAALRREMANSMITQLKSLGISERKILWEPPVDIWKQYFLRS